MYKSIIGIICIFFILNGCSSKKPKVIVLGMDGITFDIAEQWIEEGKLPNFKRIIDEGTSGRLISTIPFVSPVAWTSAITGVNPGKHSIFSFVRGVTFEKGEGISHLNLSTDRKAKAIWQIIGESEKRSILINIPQTSPPEEINGVMFSGEPHADSDHPQGISENLTYPPGVKSRFPNYRVDPSGVEYDASEPKKFLSDRFDIARRREKVLFELMQREDWDLTWVVFTITDIIQHYYWKYMDSTHVLFDKEEAKEYGDAIFRVYQMMDETIGKTLKVMDENTTLIIMSDHGFGPIIRAVNTENFLREYLPNSIRKWIIAYDYVSPVFKVNTPPSGGRKQYDKVRLSLYKALKELKDPENNRKVNKDVFLSEEIYKGPWLSAGPDVVAYVDTVYRYIGYKADPNKSVLMQLDANGFNAYHERDGVVIMFGNNIKSGVKLNLPSIMDVTPTILYLFGEKLPLDLDGKIIKDGLEKEFLKNNPPVYGGYSVSYPTNRDAEGKLKSLGYL